MVEVGAYSILLGKVEEGCLVGQGCLIGRIRYTKFYQNPSIYSKDIEQKQNFDVNQGP